MKDKKIKVLHILGSFVTGGIESHLLNFLKNADVGRFEHFFFVGEDEGQLKEQYHKLPIKIKVLKCTPKRFFYSLIFGWYFCKINGIDVIHGHNYWFYRYAFFLSLLTNVPLFTSNYGLGNWKKKRHLMLEAMIFKRAKINISVSRAILEKELSLASEPEKSSRKYKLVYPVIGNITPEILSLYNKDEIRRKIGIADNEFILTVIGRIDELKGHRYAIEAVDIINRAGLRANLLIVGPMLDPSILKEVALNKPYIKYLSYYKQLEEIWAVTDCFLIPSVSEGTPLVLLEYFAVGKPVIASAISGNKELIKDGWNGFLFESRNVDDLVEKIKLVIGHDGISEVRNNAVKFFRDNLSPVRLTREIESCYCEYA